MAKDKATESPYRLFTPEEEKEIIQAIGQAEDMTSGEIRVHISDDPDDDALEKTKLIFNELKMFKTKDRNGVLIHLALGSKTFAIYGDVGIHQKVEDHFWNTTKDMMQNHFKNGEMKTGLIIGIKEVGEKLKRYFPYQLDDVNELPDEITYDE